MKALPAFAIGLMLSSKLFGQFNTSEGTLYPAHGSEGYKMEEENFNHQLIHRLFTNMHSNKPALEFKRYDANHYVRIEYDSAGKLLSRGIIGQNNTKAMHYKIVKPDLEKDPELTLGIVKDTILYDEYFDKNGHWEEMEADGKRWEGSYVDGIRNGIWKRVMTGPSSNTYSVDSFAIYQNGVPLSNTYASSSVTQLFPMLAGNWFADRASSSKMYQVYYRNPATPFEKEFIQFVSPTEFTLHTNQDIQKASWSFENNQLNIKIADHVSKVAIVYLDGQTLIVQNLAN